MKVSIFGYNLFGIGGTVRSNLNTIYEFAKNPDNEIVYYNFVEFNNRDVRKLVKEHPYLKDVKFKPMNALFKLRRDESDTSLYFITRESFFAIAKLIRSKRPNATILGEIHAPLAFLSPDIEEYLPYFSYIRVATDSIKKEFIDTYGFDRVFVQRVSLEHLSREDMHANTPTTNFAVMSRFFEKQKDIAYSIRLIDYLVNYMHQDDIRFYIQGSGGGKRLYQNLINYYHLEEHVFINEPLPDDYIYLSTAGYETLGYSIVEAVDQSRLACVYVGEDKVNYENLHDVKAINWLTGELEHDAQVMLDTTTEQLSQADMQDSIEAIMAPSDDYLKNMMANVAEPVHFDESLTRPLTEDETALVKNDIVNQTITTTSFFSKFRKVYRKMKRWPIIGKLVKSPWIKSTIKNEVLKLDDKRRVDKELPEIQEHYFFFESFHGKNFSGDPKYLALAIAEKYPDAKIFVSSVNQLVDIEIRNYGFEAVRLGSKAYLDAFSRSKYIFVNGNTLDRAGKRPEQIVVETWHGFPIKKMVNDLEDPEQRQNESEKFAPRMQKWDYLTTASDYQKELLSSAFRLEDNEHLTILNEGTPKNGYVMKEKDSELEKERLHVKYFNAPMQPGKKYVLFCPTWRKDKRQDVTELDLKEVIDQLPENYEIIVKLHPLEGRMRAHYADLDPRIHCFYNELVDIQELYILSDVLISDYSSAMFDFAHTGRKIILLQEDAEEYTNQIGMYFDAQEVLGLKGKAYTAEELAQEIVHSEQETPADHPYDARIVDTLLNKDSIDSAQEILDSIGL
ncbi:CDP-glycerol glycerophosphotransferase (TagB/SpsB family) [Weissella uvarum]|uniref:CDP-glycerol glycerophosphotransferase family protein n=1 Tax=Weissella uvarum TaxID=1479233 RepID=UPI001960BACC|nr:CDP-glycerol glycerophosphotransferase family protein [Weissella uvarum]MBM7616581.1 CDP-glycerol glycerophosphotransferase (TagB/SpsB family) [Weissella uvarum]MCM0594960.1 CDP-glycerol glycerophosphotransferase family protein [Weissella uvarum]